MFRQMIVPALALAALVGTPAIAEETVSLTVHFGDLNIASPQGRAVLERRIERAVETICGEPYKLDLKGQQALRACILSTRADTDARLAQILGGGERMAANTVRVTRR